MTHWENSQSTAKRHTHTTIRNAQGQEVCSSCHQIVITPITSSDDERLDDAGLMRSPHHDKSVMWSVPLPEILIGVYNELQGAFPIAPYLLTVISELEQRDADSLHEGMWTELSNKTES